MVRLKFFEGANVVEIIDLPDSCTIRTAIRWLESRGWIEKDPGFRYNGIAMLVHKELGRNVFIEPDDGKVTNEDETNSLVPMQVSP